MQIAACKCILLHWRSLHVAMYNSVLIGQSAPRDSYHRLEVAECVRACMHVNNAAKMVQSVNL